MSQNDTLTHDEKYSLTVWAITRLIADAQNGRVREDRMLAQLIARCIHWTDSEKLRVLWHLLERLDEKESAEGISPGIVFLFGSDFGPEFAPPGEPTAGSIAIHAVHRLVGAAERKRLQENKELVLAMHDCIYHAKSADLRILKYQLERYEEPDRPDLQPWWSA